MKEILTVRNLTKEYFVKTGKETVKVIKGINLSITEGEKVGYVGLNGAGKSTTISQIRLTRTGCSFLVNTQILHRL